ncbi:MAG TPA: ABC transporter permease [Dermatophilaceae bacterium]|nr:ABC transporter permease [Dermatophilaceae bacterium]
MTAFRTLTLAQTKGFLRDRQTLFWIILFPLMFLLIFGSVFRDAGATQSRLEQVGAVSLLDQMPPDDKSAFASLFEVNRTDDEAAAIEKVRKGDADAAIQMQGNTVVLHYTQADQVRAARIRGIMESFVQGANVSVSGRPPTFRLDVLSVEDASLKPIQYIAPGLLGWAIAMGAVFGPAMPLVTWRTTGLLRRLRLSPTSTAVLVGSRTLVTLVVALVQMAIFLAVGVLLFGLRLTAWWWMAVPLVLAAALAFMAIGLLVGAVSKTPDGASGLANLIIMPMAFLSGSFISLEGAPEWMLTISKVLPLGYLNSGMIDVMVRGEGPGAIVYPMLILLGFALVFALIATRVFRWDA